MPASIVQFLLYFGDLPTQEAYGGAVVDRLQRLVAVWAAEDGLHRLLECDLRAGLRPAVVEHVLELVFKPNMKLLQDLLLNPLDEGLDELRPKPPLEDEPARLLVPEPPIGDEAVVVELVEQLPDRIDPDFCLVREVLGGYLVDILECLDDLHTLVPADGPCDVHEGLIADAAVQRSTLRLRSYNNMKLTGIKSLNGLSTHLRPLSMWLYDL